MEFRYISLPLKNFHMEATSTFFRAWDQYMYIGAAACVALGVLILLYHEFKVLKLKDFKQKYDYVNLHEIPYFWYTIIAFICAAAFYANTIATNKILDEGIRWFYVRIFITASFAVIAYNAFYSLVRVYYPRHLEKRLMKLRNAPRVSPDGNVMRKLTESEEEHHLEQLIHTEEDIHSVDYDIWLDEQTGFKKVEKYPAYQHVEECSECAFFTMKLEAEEIEEAPTFEHPGSLLKHYRCTYCGHREQRETIVAKLSANVA
jgi:hypothetical protein